MHGVRIITLTRRGRCWWWRARCRKGDLVEGAADAGAGFEHVQVDHRGRDIAVPQEFLNGSYVVAGTQELRGKRVAEDVGGHSLVDARRAAGRGDGTLDRGGVDVPP